MQQYLLMDKRVVVRHIQWRALKAIQEFPHLQYLSYLMLYRVWIIGAIN